MFRTLHGRLGHYLLLVVVWAALCLVNLGKPSLWDIDEGNNAQCAREMYEANDWIVPTFNYDFRVDKPALLYWLQISGYHLFGVNEFSARLPSALAALGAILVLYELGRRMFGAGAGLLAGLILASTLLFCGAAHFANPDALLCFCTLLCLFIFWRDFERGGDGWLRWFGLSSGLGMLAKGPVGLVLPAAVVGLFLLWSRQVKRLFRPAFWQGSLLFILVAAPWYGWVIAETRGVFFRGFFLQHNVGRFLGPMENHHGPAVYYLLVLMAGFAPWSVFYFLSAWHIRHHVREQKGDPRYRFLACRVVVYLGFFSLARTKLPNYVLPIYPAVALVMAHFLDRWRRGEITLPAWGMPITLGCLLLIGVATAAAFIVGGSAGVSLLRGRNLPGLESWAIVGIVPLLGSLAVWWYLRDQRRLHALTAFTVCAVLWMGLFAGWGAVPVEPFKATRELGDLVHEHGGNEDPYVASYGYFQPSLVFYSRRKVVQLEAEQQVVTTLDYPTPSYVFLPATTWERLAPRINGPHHVLGRRRDLYRGIDIVLVCNR